MVNLKNSWVHWRLLVAFSHLLSSKPRCKLFRLLSSVKAVSQINWPFHQGISDDNLSSSGEIAYFCNISIKSTTMNSPWYYGLMVVCTFSQERIAKSHGSQCGFCTPGIVMSMYTLLRNNPEPHMEDIEDAFQGKTHSFAGVQPVLLLWHLLHPVGWRCTII